MSTVREKSRNESSSRRVKRKREPLLSRRAKSMDLERALAAEDARREKANALIASRIDGGKLRALCEENSRNSDFDDAE
jgi:hypothetical protein